MKCWIFGLFLAVAAGQDFRKKEVDVWVYLLFGGAAFVVLMVDVLAGNMTFPFLSIGLGILLLGISAVSCGGVGVGDGCFFLVSGMVLTFWENLFLFGYGTLLCGLFSLGYLMWMRVNKKSAVAARRRVFPFLPFLLLPGIWLLCSGRM